MRKQNGRQRILRLGAKSSRIPSTTDGGQATISSSQNDRGDDHVFWRACFLGVLRGSTAAQRKLPSPKLLAHWASLVADCGLKEDRERRLQHLKKLAQGIVIPLVVGLLSACCGGDKGPTAPSTPTQTRIISLEAGLEFGDVPVGSSAERFLRIYNNGNAPLTVKDLSVPSNVYSAKGPAGGNIIQPAQSVQYTITFSPTEPRTYNGMLTVNADQTGGNNTTPISGRGQAPPFKRTGTGANVFDIPSYVTRIHITADYGGSCENFIVHIAGRSIVNEILGRCSVAIGPHYDGTHLISGGVAEVKSSSGVNWVFEEVR